MALKKVSMCRFCECVCGILVTVENGRPVHAEGDRNHPVSRGYTCGKPMAMVDIANDPDRIVHPMKRVAGKLEPISWGQALQEIGTKVRKLKKRYGPDALGLYMGSPAAVDYATVLFTAAFQGALGIRNAWSSGSQDCQNKFFAAELMFGSFLYHPYPDIERTDCLIILGGQPGDLRGHLRQFPLGGQAPEGD